MAVVGVTVVGVAPAFAGARAGLGAVSVTASFYCWRNGRGREVSGVTRGGRGWIGWIRSACVVARRWGRGGVKFRPQRGTPGKPNSRGSTAVSWSALTKVGMALPKASPSEGIKPERCVEFRKAWNHSEFARPTLVDRGEDRSPGFRRDQRARYISSGRFADWKVGVEGDGWDATRVPVSGCAGRAGTLAGAVGWVGRGQGAAVGAALSISASWKFIGRADEDSGRICAVGRRK